MEEAVEECNKCFRSIVLTNENQRELDALLRSAFDYTVSPNNLIESLRSSVKPEILTVREVRVNCEQYQVLCSKLTDREIKAPETHVTGPLIIRKLIAVIKEGAQRIRKLK